MEGDERAWPGRVTEPTERPDTWRFSIDVARSWEQAAAEAVVPHTRKVLLRSAMTMSPDRGGVFVVLLRLVRWGLGGRSCVLCGPPGGRFGLPAAKWMVEIGALLLRTESELVLKSRRVVPGRLLQSGFTFQFPTWDQAASDLCRRWREWNREGPAGRARGAVA